MQTLKMNMTHICPTFQKVLIKTRESPTHTIIDNLLGLYCSETTLSVYVHSKKKKND